MIKPWGGGTHHGLHLVIFWEPTDQGEPSGGAPAIVAEDPPRTSSASNWAFRGKGHEYRSRDIQFRGR